MSESEGPGEVESQAAIWSFSSNSVPGRSLEGKWRPSPDDLEWEMRAGGANEEHIAEAKRRLKDGPAALHAWLEEQRDVDPPVCSVCGLQLVDRDWRGSGTVTCERCGTTWRVTVDAPDRYGLSGVSGPSMQWLQDHPDNGIFTVGAVDVILGDLPPVPAEVVPDVYFPVARWRSEQRAAVLFLRRIPDELTEVDGGRWEDLVVFLQRVGQQWEEVFSDASTSFLDPLNPADGFFERFGAWLGEIYCDADESDPDALWLLGGRAGPGVSRIEAVTDSGIEAFEPQGRDGFFLAALTGAGSFRFVDADGAVVTTPNGRRLVLPTGD